MKFRSSLITGCLIHLSIYPLLIFMLVLTGLTCTLPSRLANDINEATATRRIWRLAALPTVPAITPPASSSVADSSNPGLAATEVQKQVAQQPTAPEVVGVSNLALKDEVVGSPQATVPPPAVIATPTPADAPTHAPSAIVPTGNTQFNVKTGDLDFHSSNYEELGLGFPGQAKAMYTGVGTINGGGNYGFLLSPAIDAPETAASDDGDTYHIKIWDKDSGDAVVYDNQVVCSALDDNADPCTVLGAGS